MIKKLTKNELSDLLISRDKTKYLYELNVLHNTGNPNLAVTEMYGYSIGNDIVIVNVYCFDGYSVYFEVSDFNNLQYIHDEIENDIKKYKEILLISDSEQLFQNPVFIRLFGKHDFIESEMYGMLHFENNGKIDEHVRILTTEDKELICSFTEPKIKYHENLRNAYETYIKNFDKNYAVYGYIDNQKEILGYLISNTYDRKYWDIAYIYVAEKARGNGIAKKLAEFYVSDVISKGGFASYGTPENQISKKVAISSGFELFSKTYLTEWMSAENLQLN